MISSCGRRSTRNHSANRNANRNSSSVNRSQARVQIHNNIKDVTGFAPRTPPPHAKKFDPFSPNTNAIQQQISKFQLRAQTKPSISTSTSSSNSLNDNANQANSFSSSRKTIKISGFAPKAPPKSAKQFNPVPTNRRNANRIPKRSTKVNTVVDHTGFAPVAPPPSARKFNPVPGISNAESFVFSNSKRIPVTHVNSGRGKSLNSDISDEDNSLSNIGSDLSNDNSVNLQNQQINVLSALSSTGNILNSPKYTVITDEDDSLEHVFVQNDAHQHNNINQRTLNRTPQPAGKSRTSSTPLGRALQTGVGQRSRQNFQQGVGSIESNINSFETLDDFDDDDTIIVVPVSNNNGRELPRTTTIGGHQTASVGRPLNTNTNRHTLQNNAGQVKTSNTLSQNNNVANTGNVSRRNGRVNSINNNFGNTRTTQPVPASSDSTTGINRNGISQRIDVTSPTFSDLVDVIDIPDYGDSPEFADDSLEYKDMPDYNDDFLSNNDNSIATGRQLDSLEVSFWIFYILCGMKCNLLFITLLFSNVF